MSFNEKANIGLKHRILVVEVLLLDSSTIAVYDENYTDGDREPP